MIDIDFNSQVFKDRLGYYVVGDKKFYNKHDATTCAAATNQVCKFIFNDRIYSAFDWRIPIHTPLNDLYRARALQLRNSYDYLMVFFSGGIDSTTVLRSFIDNNIFVDEIVMFYPKDQHFDPNNRDFANHYGEIEHSANIFLKNNINLIGPKTKITYLDMHASISNLSNRENWVEEVSHFFVYVTTVFLGSAESLSTHRAALNLAMKGKTVARIYGIDKPLVKFLGDQDNKSYAQNSLWLNFHDVHQENFLGMHNIGGGIVSGLTNTQHTELFFWTPHMPEIVIKQAQVINAVIDLDQDLVRTCSVFLNGQPTILNTHRLYSTKNYENKIARLIYTHTNDVIWQIEKPSVRTATTNDFSVKYNFFYKIATKNQLSILSNGMQYLNQNKLACLPLYSKKYLVRS